MNPESPYTMGVTTETRNATTHSGSTAFRPSIKNRKGIPMTSKAVNRVDLNSPELMILRAAIARHRSPENESAYYREIARHIRTQADEFDRRAAELLSA